MITPKDLLVHKAQQDTIENRIYALAEAADYQKPHGTYKPQYFLEKYEIRDGCIRARFHDSRAQDVLNMEFTFDEMCGDG